MDDNSTCPLSPVHQLLPYPISRHEAELHWEMARQKERARIAALPSSSFERTMLEEDERFYATFPQARQAAIDAWIAQTFPYAPWAQLSSVSHEDMSMDIIVDLPKAHTQTTIHPPAPDFSGFTLAHALAVSPSHLEVPEHRPLTIFYDSLTKVTERDLNTSSINHFSRDRAGSPQGYDSNQRSPAAQIVPESCSMPTTSKQEPVLLALQVLAPARRTRSARNTRKIFACRPQITSKKQENGSPSTFFATPPASTSEHACIPASPPCEQYTGDWKADAIVASEHLHTSRMHATEKPPVSFLPPPSKKSEADLSPTRSQPFSPRKMRLSSRSRRHSNAPYKRPGTLPASRELTPMAPRKRAKLLRDKDGKPVMACLFCRGRKIACGPPPQGSDDPTCNQCARRGVACHYPTESRRGQRKKRVDFINTQSDDISTLLDLYRNATLKDDGLLDMPDDSDSDCDGRDL